MYSGMLIISKHMPIIPAVVAAHSKAGNKVLATAIVRERALCDFRC